MPATIAGSHLGIDRHANRPAANAAGQPIGALYSCSTHGLIYKTDGSTWSTYATLSGTDTNGDRKSTRLNSSHGYISYAVFCLHKTSADVGARRHRHRARVRARAPDRARRC